MNFPTKSIDKYINELELNEERGLFYYHKKDDWENLFPYRTKNILAVIKPYAFYCFNKQPFVLFFENPKSIEREIEIHRSVWNFQTPVVIIDKGNQIEIYNGLSLRKNKNYLEKLADAQDIKDFSFWELQSGKTWEKYQSHFSGKRIDNYLLENISGAIKSLTESNEKINSPKKKEIANNLIGRLIFTRYLIDRKVKLDSNFIKEGNERDSFLSLLNDKPKLYKFFDYLREKFNGNLFPVESDEFRLITQKHLAILYNLFSGTNVNSGQLSLFDVYDFNIIPIELISNIYERFIGKENQDINKAFYTPAFLVDYVLSQTVKPFLKNNDTCKVLDPSCGSGIFLVETLRHLIEQSINKKGGINDTELKRLVIENIFGIDKDESAINIAIFSLYITLLDYKEPKEIENFKFPVLRDTNFFVNDFFDSSIDNKLKSKRFDFIIGNPPWGSIKEELHKIFIKLHPIISDYQIAQSFIIRSKYFCSDKTKCAFIVTSKILYNIKAKKFREYLLKDFALQEVFEISAVRRQIFNHAIGPAAILFYQYAPKQDNSSNIINHISLKPNRFFKLFKTIVIEKYDNKKVLQSYFQKYDWLWKVFLYGNVLDYYFIRKLKSEFPTINEVIKDNSLIQAQGITIYGKDKKDSTNLIGKEFLDSGKRILNKFYLDANQLERWTRKVIHRNPSIENPLIFKAPFILIKFAHSSNFNAISAFVDTDIVFSNLITAIKGKNKDVNTLKSLCGLINSKLFTYYILNIGSSIGIEREVSHNKDEKFTFPVKIDNQISKTVDKIQELYKKEYSTDILGGYKNKIQAEEQKLNNLIFDVYSLNDTERDLIDYALNVSIPLYQQNETPFRTVNSNEFKEYAMLFVIHFTQRYNREREFFRVDIYQEKYFAAMHFKIVKEKPHCVINFSEEKDTKEIFNLLTKFSTQQITECLYLQKDIKGFEKDSFYVIKPNEYKNWHPAIARLDIAEFTEAILEVEQKNYLEKYE